MYLGRKKKNNCEPEYQFPDKKLCGGYFFLRKKSSIGGFFQNPDEGRAKPIEIAGNKFCDRLFCAARY